METYDSIQSLNNQRTSYRVFTILVIVSQILAVAVAVMVGVWMGVYNNGFSWTDVNAVFSYHALFMILGLVVCYGHAILVYRIWRNERKICTKLLHAGLHLLAVVFAALGLKAVFDSHNNHVPPLKNLYSLHSWMGILTIALFSAQWVAGFLTFLLPFCSKAVRVCLKPIHVYAGIVIFLMAIATALMGLTERAIFKGVYPDDVTQSSLINSIGLTLVALALVTVFIVVNPNYRRLPTPDEEEDRQALHLTH